MRRRSVRNGFANRAIPVPVLEEIVACGLAAPSSKDAQPWRLHVVTSQELLWEIAGAVESAEGADRYSPSDPTTGEPWVQWSSTVTESAGTLRACAAGILVENRGAFSRGRDTLASVPKPYLVASLVGYTFEIVGIGAAIQNMWIAANSLGVQGTFLGDVVVADAAIRDRVGIECDLIGLLALGYGESHSPVRVSVESARDPNRVVWHV